MIYFQHMQWKIWHNNTLMKNSGTILLFGFLKEIPAMGWIYKDSA